MRESNVTSMKPKMSAPASTQDFLTPGCTNFIQNSRGICRLVDDVGYVYHKDRYSRENNKIYWRCQRRSLCKGRALTVGDCLIGLTGAHNHPRKL